MRNGSPAGAAAPLDVGGGFALDFHNMVVIKQ